MKRKSYHFSVGNSDKGPIGYCARILADSEEDAVKKLRLILPEQKVVYGEDDGPLGDEYLAVDFNYDKFPTVHDIDEEPEEVEVYPEMNEALVAEVLSFGFPEVNSQSTRVNA